MELSFEKVLPKEKEGTIPGDAELLKQYIGEAYFFRALAYYNALVRFGDYPIITEVLPDDSETLIKKVSVPRAMKWHVSS